MLIIILAASPHRRILCQVSPAISICRWPLRALEWQTAATTVRAARAACALALRESGLRVISASSWQIDSVTVMFYRPNTFSAMSLLQSAPGSGPLPAARIPKSHTAALLQLCTGLVLRRRVRRAADKSFCKFHAIRIRTQVQNAAHSAETQPCLKRRCRSLMKGFSAKAKAILHLLAECRYANSFSLSSILQHSLWALMPRHPTILASGHKSAKPVISDG